jgi:hypothetical protein
MFNKRKIAAVLILTLFAFGSGASLHAQKNQKKEYKVRITWEAVPGSGGYLVEIRDRKSAVLFSKETDTNEVYPRLPLGDYTMRITVYDKFKNVADATPWAKITVKYTESPMFEKVEPSQIVIGESTGELVIRGDNFGDRTGVEIQGPPPIRILKKRVVSDEEIVVSIDSSSAEPGLYSITLDNGDSKSVVAKNVLKVKGPEVKSRTPEATAEISSISPSKIIIPSSAVKVSVSGRKFSRDAKVFVSQDGKEYPAPTTFKSDTELEASIPSESLKLGTCELIVRQGDASARYRGVPVAMLQDGLLGLGGLDVAGGYNGFAIMGDWGEYFKGSTKGFNVYLGHHFYKRYFSRGAAVFGVECDVSYNTFEHKSNSSKWKSEMKVLQNRLGLYLSTDLRVPVNLLLRVDGGLARSSLSVKYSGGNETKNSYDPLFSFGIALKWNILKTVFVEGGADMTNIMFKSTPMQGVRYFARAGISL